MKLQSLAGCVLLSAALAASAQNGVNVVRATELRSDKLASASVVAPLAAGARVQVISMEGGWALVATGSAGTSRTGWVRASAIDVSAGASGASTQSNGRMASDNFALTLGVRSLPPRINRHALIIGISRYAEANVPPLPGAHIDRESATQMAGAMQVPASNINYLQDEQATGNNIRAAIRKLTETVQEGDRVFIHYSGHGTRYNDPVAGGCVEALLAYDGGQSGTLTNREMADLLKPITNKTDKLIVMYDACHSGGLVNAAATVRTRGVVNLNDEGSLRPKFANISEECGRPVNIKSRNLVIESTDKGALPQDIIHISAARDNEISFDDELKGGLATEFMRDCMLRDARDLDGSGAISIDEIRICAQEKLDKRMKNDPNFKPHNISLSGNANFVPAWFSQALPTAMATTVATAAPVVAAPAAPVPAPAPVVASPPAAPQPAKPPVVSAPPANKPAMPPAPLTAALPPPAPQVNKPATPPAPAPVPVAPAPVAPAPTVAMVATPAVQPPVAVAPALTGEQALRQMFEQRDAKRQVQVTLARSELKIGQDALEWSVKSNRAGFVYVALAGSDNKSLYLLFPNDLDQSNRIEAGQTINLPRANWRAKAGGPAGKDNLLVLVTDGPRDLSTLAASKAGPFVTSLNDADGRARLGGLMSSSRIVTSQECTTAATRRNNPLCSDAYGAAMVSVDEVR
jgi:hypothetical protein